MKPGKSLPYPEGHQNEDAFVQELLQYASECKLLQILCGGVHILDFLVRDPDLYSSVLPTDWHAWLSKVAIMDLIELLNVENVDQLLSQGKNRGWREYDFPPHSMLEYISSVHKFLLDRTFVGQESRPRGGSVKPLSRALSMGMKSKKIHEVEQFSAFVKDMVEDLTEFHGYDISDIVDFGAGQGYLGRVLASPLYKLDVVSVESKAHNIDGAKRNDVIAKVANKEIIYRNKKLWRAGVDKAELERLERLQTEEAKVKHKATLEADQTRADVSECGTIRHIEHIITGGDLAPVVEKLKMAKGSTPEKPVLKDPQLMVISLHSCGNLLHHGLRSLTANPSVRAVAMIGCCYNLCTERLGAPTYKLPGLRSPNRRLLETSQANDAAGYPMSEKFATFKHSDDRGIRLNITARMMAVQAPRNWTKEDTESFFTKHFYRALLQRIFLDHRIIEPMVRPAGTQGVLPEDLGGAGAPITIGSLSKTCFRSFTRYVRGALRRLANDETRGESFRALDAQLSDGEIEDYEERYSHRRHDLCVLWSFMAFSAGIVETLMVTDRWQWLREQEDVAACWVQTVFDYGQSPRNLAVVGIKA